MANNCPPILAPSPVSSLSSLDDEQHDFYEGAEKLLELWFEPDATTVAQLAAAHHDRKHPQDCFLGLRAIPRADLDSMLAEVKCTVLHASRYEYMDSYVLSESSMFVAPFRLIIKTCGTTSLLPAVPRILALAKQFGLVQVNELFFSRRNFGRPELQPFPHQDFDAETVFLDKLFDGRATTLGADDQWHLYTLNRLLPLGGPDQTFEVIMTHLDPQAMSLFFQKDGRTAASVTQESGIATLFPGAFIDDFLFEPCGYSMNGVLDDGYFTIHITPQAEFSYVSFETDIPLVIKIKIIKINNNNMLGGDIRKGKKER